MSFPPQKRKPSHSRRYCSSMVSEADQRKQDGDTAGIPDRLNIRIGYKLAVVRQSADNNADQRFCRFRFHFCVSCHIIVMVLAYVKKEALIRKSETKKEKKMRKKVIALAMIAAMVVSLTACGGKNNDKQGKDSTESLKVAYQSGIAYAPILVM